MAKIEDCPGFETFGADVKAARKAKQLSRSALADMIHCDSRYLANIENEGTLPSLPVVIQLIKICGLPVERYFNPELMREESAERQRVSHKLQLCRRWWQLKLGRRIGSRSSASALAASSLL